MSDFVHFSDDICVKSEKILIVLGFHLCSTAICCTLPISSDARIFYKYTLLYRWHLNLSEPDWNPPRSQRIYILKSTHWHAQRPSLATIRDCWVPVASWEWEANIPIKTCCHHHLTGGVAAEVRQAASMCNRFTYKKYNRSVGICWLPVKESLTRCRYL